MRKIFNDGMYWEKARSGELVVVLLEHRHPSRIEANEPFCTYSQMISYRDPSCNNEVARVHQYLRSDKTIGASGKPDPKRVLVGATLYRLHKAQKNP